VEAQHVLLAEPLLESQVEAQAIGRVHRMSQTRPTFVHRFMMRGTIEEAILGLREAEGDGECRSQGQGGGSGGGGGGGGAVAASPGKSPGSPSKRARRESSGKVNPMLSWETVQSLFGDPT
jgi:hypothetical protein